MYGAPSLLLDSRWLPVPRLPRTIGERRSPAIKVEASHVASASRRVATSYGYRLHRTFSVSFGSIRPDSFRSYVTGQQ